MLRSCLSVLVGLALTTCSGLVFAQGVAPSPPICVPAPRPTMSAYADGAAVEDAQPSVVSRAKDLLARARFLDESALSDERVATDLDKKLPQMRDALAKALLAADARPAERQALVARAESIEADITVSEAEILVRRRSAVDNRRVAREFRERAVALVKAESAPPPPPPKGSAGLPLYLPAQRECSPPFAFTPDGRKVYKIECL